MNWRSGDMVVLVCGGPVMAIGEVRGAPPGHVEVIWFSGLMMLRAFVRGETLRAATAAEMTGGILPRRGGDA